MATKTANVQATGSEVLLLTPGRAEENTLLGMQNMLAALPAGRIVSLEICADETGIRFHTRAPRHVASVRHLLQSQYPQSSVTPLIGDDYLVKQKREIAVSRVLHVDGEPYLPIRTFTDTDLLNPGADPLVTVLGTLGDLNHQERVVTRLLIEPLPPDWASEWINMAMGGAGSANQQLAEGARPAPMGEGSFGMDDILKIGLVGAAAVAFFTWQAYNSGDILKAAAIAGGSLLGVAAVYAFYRKVLRKDPPVYHDPAIVAPRISGAGFSSELQVNVVVPWQEGPERAEIILDTVTSAYSQMDNPLGAYFRPTQPYPHLPDPDHLLEVGGLEATSRRRFLSGPIESSTLGATEVASLWHPPRPSDDNFAVHRKGGKVLPPTFSAVDGAEIGVTTGGTPTPVHLPDDTLRRHALYVARTRMGKSTLMQHVIAHKMEMKARGLDDDAIIVVDPHADLVDALLALVPQELIEQGKVKLIDVAAHEQIPGINPLDVHIFTDRDRTADGLNRVAKGQWEAWGPRMQNILEHSVKSLHQANAHPSTPRDKQYTLLQVHDMLSDAAKRKEVLLKVEDMYLQRWWQDFQSWDDRLRSEAITPVLTRISYYASSERARHVLGQPSSTLDIHKTIQDGDVLLVSTAQGTVGRDVAGLVGACVLNLVDSIIRQQGELPPEERRSALVAVDEMQSIPGVDYEGMLGEVGKFGGSLLLATQSLSKLDEIRPTMKDVILANNGLLVVWQVAATDAMQLVYELGSERITAEDLTSQPVYHCYVRATSGGERMPAFSMKVREPRPGRLDLVRRVRAGTGSYTRTRAEVLRLVDEPQRKRMVEWMDGLHDETPLHARESGRTDKHDPEPDHLDDDDQSVFDSDRSSGSGTRSRRRTRSKKKPNTATTDGQVVSNASGSVG